MQGNNYWLLVKTVQGSERDRERPGTSENQANEYAEERRIYKDLISKNNNVDILNSASRILQC